MDNIFKYCISASFPQINRDNGEGFTPALCQEIIYQAIDKLPEHIQALFNAEVLSHIVTRLTKVISSPLTILDYGTLYISLTMNENLGEALLSCLIQYKPATAGVTRNVTAMYDYRIVI